ncbi:hypothetical protein [Micromonospora sp. b486]|uniref:hypothetical protein n=1 Tax=Micromonospora sp. b486 TaxID=3053986 RepID=UPI00259C6C81|nr:hypothetical protein [Micromonospora sp. b486]MDM4784698.1 hypothetical protein [Micromonospora sp. b486]
MSWLACDRQEPAYARLHARLGGDRIGAGGGQLPAVTPERRRGGRLGEPGMGAGEDLGECFGPLLDEVVPGLVQNHERVDSPRKLHSRYRSS